MTLATETHTLEFKPAHVAGLARAIANCLLFAGKETYLPVLCCIRFEFDGSRLRLVSTDRYRLCVEIVEHYTGDENDPRPPVEAFNFLLERDHAKTLLADLKRDRLMPIEISFDGRTVRVTRYESSTEWRAYEGSFPARRQLLPDVKDRAPVDEIGFTYPFVADLGKVATDSKSKYIRIHIFGARKPTRIDYLEGPTVMLMPVTVDNNPTALWGVDGAAES